MGGFRKTVRKTVESAKGSGEGRGGETVRKTVESAKGSGEWRGGETVRKTVESAKGSGEGRGGKAVERGRRGLDSRGLVDFLIRDVDVDFLGEVVVFAVHLCSQVAGAGVRLIEASVYLVA